MTSAVTLPFRGASTSLLPAVAYNHSKRIILCAVVSMVQCSTRSVFRVAFMYDIFSCRPQGKAAVLKSLQESSVSSVAKELNPTTAQQFFQEMPVYAHWLALKMLRVHESAKTKLAATNSELKFNIARQRFVVDMSLLSKASDAIQAACNLESTVQNSAVSRQGVLTDANLFSSELAFTAITACHLDRFLFSGKDAKVGFCLHQGPTRKRPKQRGNPEAADFMCAGMKTTVMDHPWL